MFTGTVQGRDARTTVRGYTDAYAGTSTVNSRISVVFRLQPPTGGDPVQVEIAGSRLKGQLSDGDAVTVVKGRWTRNGRVLRAKTLWNHTVKDSAYVTLFRPRER